MAVKFLAVPPGHEVLKAIGYKQYAVFSESSVNADLYIHFKTQKGLELHGDNCWKELAKLGGAATQCHWDDDFHLRVTFFDQKLKEKPPEVLKAAIAIARKLFDLSS